jgi:hypothetical protein
MTKTQNHVSPAAFAGFIVAALAIVAAIAAPVFHLATGVVA